MEIIRIYLDVIPDSKDSEQWMQKSNFSLAFFKQGYLSNQ